MIYYYQQLLMILITQYHAAVRCLTTEIVSKYLHASQLRQTLSGWHPGGGGKIVTSPRDKAFRYFAQ